ncbi:protein valois [Drosophila tropicalis]|uniref:protein valois n=1 Tax=Drosophila tropicalis TaxID=46794 RepID=UPI0035AB979F
MFPQRSSVVYRTPASHQPPPATELAGNVEYPNLNVDDLNARFENLSPRLHECWDSISINDQEHCALATNRREGPQWWGIFYGYTKNQLGHISVDNADFKLQSENTVNIVRYADNNVLLVALGDTRLQAWSTYSTVRDSKAPYCLFLVGEMSVHPTPISELCVFRANRRKAVTASSDGTLNVWDLSGADLASSYHSSSSHTDKLTGLATPFTSFSEFVTCDRGGSARLWDARASTPSSVCLYDDSPQRLLSFTCAAWAGPTELQGDNYVYLGDFDGQVHSLDIRVPRKILETKVFFDTGHVSRLLINGSHLAAMSNLPSAVKIAHVKDHLEFVYCHQDTHSRLTDAIWTDNNTLITIGHGRKMMVHKI